MFPYVHCSPMNGDGNIRACDRIEIELSVRALTVYQFVGIRFRLDPNARTDRSRTEISGSIYVHEPDHGHISQKTALTVTHVSSLRRSRKIYPK